MVGQLCLVFPGHCRYLERGCRDPHDCWRAWRISALAHREWAIAGEGLYDSFSYPDEAGLGQCHLYLQHDVALSRRGRSGRLVSQASHRQRRHPIHPNDLGIFKGVVWQASLQRVEEMDIGGSQANVPKVWIEASDLGLGGVWVEVLRRIP